jgi:hypothetical protein
MTERQEYINQREHINQRECIWSEPYHIRVPKMRPNHLQLQYGQH